MGESYSTLVIQPIDLIRVFKIDFCLASVIKWLTKWQMDNKVEYLTKANYYVNLCGSDVSDALFFAIRMFCIVNGFMKDNASTCLLVDVMWDIKHGNRNDAANRLNRETWKKKQ